MTLEQLYAKHQTSQDFVSSAGFRVIRDRQTRLYHAYSWTPKGYELVGTTQIKPR